MARGGGKKGGIGWTSQSGRRQSSGGGKGFLQPRPAKKVNVHGDGKPNQNRSGGKGQGGKGAR
jgi:hypothetical protein